MRHVAVTLAALLGIVLVVSGTAAADAVWELDGHHGPTNFQPGGAAQYSFDLRNVGDAPSSGPATVTIRLPPGVRTRVAPGSPFVTPSSVFAAKFWLWNGGLECPGGAGETIATCVADGPSDPALGVPGRVTVFVDVDPGVTGPLTAEATVTGGAETVTVTETAPVGPEPGFGIAPGSFRADAFDASGRPERQAGAHPFRSILAFDVNQRMFLHPNRADGQLGPWLKTIGTLRDIEVTLPRGFVGNPLATDRCNAIDFGNATDVTTTCPVGSQVGVIDFAIRAPGGAGMDITDTHAPVYNLVPPKNAVAAFGFQVLGREVHILASLDPKDNSIVTRIPSASEEYALYHQKFTLWGVPSDPRHDADRWNPQTGSWGAQTQYRGEQGAFLTLPSECEVPGNAKVAATSWQGDADPPATAAAAGARIESPSVKLRGCERQTFNASLSAKPDVTQVDAPTGLNVRLDIDQNMSAVGLGTPPLNKVVVQLPEGVSVSPSAATGLGGCAPAEIALKTNDEPSCPDASKIGTVSVATPVLPDPLTGSVYLARQNDNPFGSMLAIYLVVRGPGIIVKLPGKVEPDPVTGQLTATFTDNPQLPFTSLDLRFKGGTRGNLATPVTCGEKTTTSQLTPWNGVLPTVVTTSSFNASYDGQGTPCPNPQAFDPNLEAGTVSPAAGKDTTFSLTFGRHDRHQYLNDISVRMPPGLVGRIASATLCSDQAANAGTCPADSKIGTSTVSAGPGASPFWLSGGRVYITRSYKGAPYGLSIATRVLAGPFDLGEVIVRAAIHVDPATSELTVSSDPLPSILQGIPLRIRTVNVAIDRSGFMINPTNCAPKSIDARISSTAGAAAQRSSRFQVGDCASLPVRPKMSIVVGRRGHVGREATTPLKVTLTQTRGQSNLRSVRVDLPDTINARLRVINQACTLVAFNAGNCGARALVGSAVAVTPLLRDPLRGQVFFVRNPARRIADLMVALRGDVTINLTGKVSIPHGRLLATTFDTIPDVPITSFTLRLVDGRQGTLGAVESLCRKENRKPPANVEIRAQNGRLVRFNQRLTINGCGRRATRGRSRTRTAGSRARRRK